MLTLFFIAFVAATLWPMASEAYVVFLVTTTPQFYLTIGLVATAGNALGSILMYELARFSAPWVEGKLVSAQQQRPKMRQTLRRIGTPLLFFAWLPVLGDALPIMAGALNFSRFNVYAWLTIGKAARYAMVIAGVLSIVPVP